MSLLNQLRLGSSLLVVNSTEPARVLEEVQTNTTKPVYRFHGIGGGLTEYDRGRDDWLLVLFDNPDPMAESDEKVPLGIDSLGIIIDFIKEKNGILVLTNAHLIAKNLLNLLCEYHYSFRNTLRLDDKRRYRHQIILITNNTDEIPLELRQISSVVEYDKPTKEILSSILGNFNSKVPSLSLTETVKDDIAQAGKGLSEQEFIDICFDQMLNEATLTSSHVFHKKRELLKKNNIMDISQPSFTLDDIGGLDVLKDLIQKLAWLWENKATAEDLAIDPISRVLLVGVPGTGKSLACQAAAAALGLEVAKGGISQSLSKWVGESESNMRQTFRTLRDLSPVVFWIDEFGRDMSGSGSSNDSGTTDRVQGEFLTGLQELPNGVFLFAAANNISQLPPEMTRSDRFDTIMFVGFPTARERVEIFKVLLGKTVENYDLKLLAGRTEFFTGAEIKAAIKEARFNVGTTRHTVPTDEDILREASNLKNRIWNNKRSEVVEMYRRAKEEWKWASSAQQAEADMVLSAGSSPTTHTISSKNQPNRAPRPTSATHGW